MVAIFTLTTNMT